MGISETSIEELADFLKSKKILEQRVGLFLGHRTGILYNKNLYEALSEYTQKITEASLKNFRQDSPIYQELSSWSHSIQLFADLPASTRSKECYNFLSNHFSESSIHSILSNVIRHSDLRIEDELVVKLIKANFFNTILTTNFDPLLEEACNDLVGIEKENDYKLFIYRSHDSKIIEESGRCGRVIKAFGDFYSRSYKRVNEEFDLEKDELLKNNLISEMAKDVIVLGYDPVWDAPIEKIFPETGGMLWYVNEEFPPPETYFARVLDRRYCKFVGEHDWNYGSFLRTLSDLIEEKANQEVKRKSSSSLISSPDSKRKKAFISYSHKDTQHLERLRIHLKGYLHKKSEKDEEAVLKIICDDFWGSIWDDTKIPVGANWQEEIEKALAQTKIAVCLVSADFFGSDFIREKELKVLNEAAHAKQVEIVSVIISDSMFEDSDLFKYQTINPPNQPLMSISSHEQEVIWRKLAKHIFTNLDA